MKIDLTEWLEARVSEITAEAKEVISEAGELIASQTRHYVETRGTAQSGKRGRIDTGAMRDSASSEVVKETEEEYEVRAGFLDAPHYTVFQERGTKHIEAMYAVSDAFEEAKVLVEGRLRNL